MLTFDCGMRLKENTGGRRWRHWVAARSTEYPNRPLDGSTETRIKSQREKESGPPPPECVIQLRFISFIFLNFLSWKKE